jgi:hypothetical protein
MNNFFFLILIFAPHTALICFLTYQFFYRKFSSPATAATLAIILANLTLVWAYNYFFTYSITFRGTYLPILLSVIVFSSTLLIHLTKYRYGAKQLAFTIPVGAIILFVSGGIALTIARIIRNSGF